MYVSAVDNFGVVVVAFDVFCSDDAATFVADALPLMMLMFLLLLMLH